MTTAADARDRERARLRREGLAQRTVLVSQTLGSNARLAAFLGVDRSRPTRWKSGEDMPGVESEAKLLALDYVLARALMVWSCDSAGVWLESANHFLGGARPIDVLDLRGAGPVIEALEAEASGAFA